MTSQQENKSGHALSTSPCFSFRAQIFTILFAHVSAHTFLKLVFVPEEPFLSVLYIFKASLVHTTKWENDSLHFNLLTFVDLKGGRLHVVCKTRARERDTDDRKPANHHPGFHWLMSANSHADWNGQKNRKKHQHTYLKVIGNINK